MTSIPPAIIIIDKEGEYKQAPKIADMPAKTPPRVRQYTATAVETSTAPDDDNFGFNETLSEWV